jgi:hypothetical protein
VKVISYSLFGSNQRYITPLIINARTIKEYYPNWIIRVYHDDTVNTETLSILISLNVDLVDINQSNVKKYNLAPKFWRFLPILENNIDVIIFRDSDSVFSKREKDLVKTWLNSEYDFHIIRDHQLHIAPIMAGMFGVKKGGFGLFKDKLLNNPILTSKNSYNSDQIFLADELFPKILNTVLINTSYFAFSSENFVKISKSTNSNHFIGAIYSELKSESDSVIYNYDFIIGIPYWFAKLLRYKIRPVLYLSIFYNFTLNRTRKK